MNIISFSLWGDKPMYMIGAYENIKLAKELYPGWTCRFYMNDSVNQEVASKILELGGEVYKVEDNLGAYYGMFWRFFVNDDPSVERFIVRDSDCRLSPREKGCVDEWVASGKGFHTMHDHFFHTGVPILGGMWGSKTGIITNMYEKVHQWPRQHNHGDDQLFLRDIIWPIVKDDCLRHDNGYQPQYGRSQRVPPHELSPFGGTFIGEIFDINNKSMNPQPYSNKRMIW
jgi:hypothetical protein